MFLLVAALMIIYLASYGFNREMFQLNIHNLLIIIILIVLLFSSLTIQYMNNGRNNLTRNQLINNKKVKINTSNNVVANDSKTNKMNNNASISLY